MKSNWSGGRMRDTEWIKNVEYVFTKEKLDELVKEGYLERTKKNNRFHYIKKGCKKDFNHDKVRKDERTSY